MSVSSRQIVVRAAPNAANDKMIVTHTSAGQKSTSGLIKLGLESLETAAVHLLSLLVSIPMLAITARCLGPAGRGEFVAVTTWAGLVATCCGLSLGLAAIHEMSKATGRNLKVLLGTLLIFAPLLSAIAWSALAGLFQIDRNAFGGIVYVQLALALIGVPLLLARDYLGALLLADGRVPAWNRVQAAGTLVSFSLVGSFAFATILTVERVILAWLVGQFFVVVVAFAILYRRAGGVKAHFTIACSLLTGGYKLHLNAIGSILIASIDVLMVNSFAGTQEVGYYQIALKLVTIVALIAQAVGTVTYGSIVKCGPDGAWQVVRRISGITMTTVTLAALLAAWRAPTLISLVAGPRFAPSIPLFRLMLLAVPGLSLSFLMAPQWICRGFFWQTSALTCFTASASALSNWFLVPLYGARGAAFSYVGVYFLSILANGAMFLFCDLHWRQSLSEENLSEVAVVAAFD